MHDRVIQSAQPFKVRLSAIHKQRIEHVAQQLSKARWQRQAVNRRSGSSIDQRRVAQADHHDFLGTESQRRAERRSVSHGAVTKPLTIDMDWWKNKRHRRASQQMIQTKLRAQPTPPSASPFGHFRRTVVESDRAPGAITRRADGHALHMTLIEGLPDTRKIHVPLQGVAQRRRVEKSPRRRHQ